MDIFNVLGFLEKFKIITYFKELSKKTKVLFVVGNLIALLLPHIFYKNISTTFNPYVLSIVVLIIVDCYMLERLPKEKLTFEINVIKDDSSDNTVAKYRIFLKNKSSEVRFDRIQVTYQYDRGIRCSLDTPYIPEHLSDISVILNIDVHNETKRTKIQKLCSPIIFPKDSREVEIRVDLIVDLGEKGYHPCYDWNITYSVVLMSTDKRELVVLKDRKWRETEFW